MYGRTDVLTLLTKTIDCMAQLLNVIFKREAIENLIKLGPDNIVVRTELEGAVLEDGTKAGVVKVYGDAYKGGKVVETVDGCPWPPCTPEETDGSK